MVLATYAKMKKQMDALIDLNYSIEEDEDMMDLEPDEEIVEEEAGWYIEEINNALISLYELCQVVSVPQLRHSRELKDVYKYIKNWKLGKWDNEYRELSKYSPVMLKTSTSIM